MASNFKTKLIKRAENEATIVSMCNKRTNELMVEARKNAAIGKKDVERKTQELVVLFQNGASEIEIEILNGEIASVEKKLQNLEQVSLMLIDVHNAFTELENNVDQAMSFGWYRYIIRMIPEKKLPNMIVSEDPDDLTKVMDLVDKINEKIKEKIVVSMKAKVAGDKKTAKTNEFAAKQIEKTRAESGKTVDAKTGISTDAMARIKQAMAKNGTVPVDANVNETANNSNTNNA